MSSTGRSADRVEFDDYPTPGWCLDALLPYLHIRQQDSFFEPCAGTGAILERVPCREKYYCEIQAGTDYLDTPKLSQVDWIITNPPFALAEQFLRKSLTEARSVAYLLRLNFLGSRRRKPFWDANPVDHLFVLSQRPQFVSVCGARAGGKRCGTRHPIGWEKPCRVCGEGPVRPGQDSCEYAWFIWDRANRVKTNRSVVVL